MKRFVCEKCKAPIRKWNPVCYSCGYKNIHLIRKMKTTRVLKTLSIIVSTVGSIVLCSLILNANLLFPWQWGARRNKQVILEYAAENYPSADIIDQEFNSAKFFIWNNIEDCVVFNLDGLEFGITAERGKILVDGYCGARAIAQFDKIIQENFLEPRGISAQTDYIFADNYYKIYPYTGSLGVIINSIDQGSTPQEVGWFYDFYKYWKKEGAFLTSYSVHLHIVTDHQSMYHLNYDDNSEFPDEAAFYSAFIVG